jgi:outer membrane protein assembly factor BamB
LASPLAALALVLAAGFSSTSSPAANAGGDWPRWRGAADQGSTDAGRYPVTWDASRPTWKAPLPGKGCSTPIVADGRIFLTAPVDGRDAALAFDLAGQPVWRTALGPETPGKHRNGSGSNPSPTTDGRGLFVAFKSGTLAALELDGRLRWQTNLVDAYGKETLYWDHGTSPVLAGSVVVMARMHAGESWLAAFDRETGALRWKVARNYSTPTEGDHGYTTPLVVREDGRETLLTWGAMHLTAHDPADGSLLWFCGGFNPDAKAFWPAVASPVVVGDVAVVPYGRSDRGEPRLHGIRLGGRGDVTTTHRLWQRHDTGTFVPSPAAARGRVILVRDRGEVEALEPATGRTIWKDALPKAAANYYASPLVAAGRLYAAREDGKIFVAEAGDAFRLLAENDLGERVVASPVAVSDRLLIRGEQHLFCFAGP